MDYKQQQLQAMRNYIHAKNEQQREQALDDCRQARKNLRQQRQAMEDDQRRKFRQKTNYQQTMNYYQQPMNNKMGKKKRSLFKNILISFLKVSFKVSFVYMGFLLYSNFDWDAWNSFKNGTRQTRLELVKTTYSTVVEKCYIAFQEAIIGLWNGLEPIIFQLLRILITLIDLTVRGVTHLIKYLKRFFLSKKDLNDELIPDASKISESSSFSTQKSAYDELIKPFLIPDSFFTFESFKEWFCYIVWDTPLNLILFLLLAVAVMTQVERLGIGRIQRRSAPILVGISGILQSFADALKLALKESFNPKNANIYLFIFSPIITLVLSLVLWTFVPFEETVLATNPSLGFLFVLGISGLSVFTIFTAGWASNSRFAFLGALRAVAQMVSYELSLGTIIVTMCFLTGSYSLNEYSIRQHEQIFIIPFFFLFLLFLVSALAETNRHPFDLPEAEAELVSGYNVEYSGIRFALFFLAEYANILFMSALIVIVFLGGWLPISEGYVLDWLPPVVSFTIKLVFTVFLFVFVRAAFPRYRYDQLMTLIWKRLLPASLGLFLAHVSLGLALGTIPPFF